ncbi:MAG: GNAT family N-acetyltransferase [Chloroflexota bacterium]
MKDRALEIRGIAHDDLEAAGIILTAAYGPPTGRDRELRRYLDAAPGGWLLALLDGRPVGMGGALCYGPCAYLGMMAVVPAAQRRGVGEALLRGVLGWLDACSCPTILLDASDMGAPLYRRHGFVDAGATLLLQCTRRRSSPASVREVTPLRDANLPAMLALDAPLYGAGRRALLASYVATYPARSFIAWGPGGTAQGYLVAQAGTLGPWVATSPDAADALLRAALALPFRDEPTVIVPAANERAVALLTRHGFTPRRTLRHMVRGRPGAPRSSLYGQASFAAG